MNQGYFFNGDGEMVPFPITNLTIWYSDGSRRIACRAPSKTVAFAELDKSAQRVILEIEVGA